MDQEADQEQDSLIRLPPDLYLPILENVHDNAQLAEICRVDRLFLDLAREKLYTFVWVRPCMCRGLENTADLLTSTLFG